MRALIVDVDDETRRLAYAVVKGRLPLVHHHASFQVFAEGESRSRLAVGIRLRVERGPSS
ncbi:MAG TPA: hypothetical protein VJY65_12060 [Chloroflexota bacterium]|nr:hypothetical protein [Chloroflexota bacterium]